MNPNIIFLLFLIMVPVVAQYEKCEAEQSLTCIITTALAQLNELIAKFKQPDGYRTEDNGEHVRAKRDIVADFGKFMTMMTGTMTSAISSMMNTMSSVMKAMIGKITGLIG